MENGGVEIKLVLVDKQVSMRTEKYNYMENLKISLKNGLGLSFKLLKAACCLILTRVMCGIRSSLSDTELKTTMDTEFRIPHMT